MSEIFAMLAFPAAALAAILLFRSAKRPKMCNLCRKQAVVELRREPNGNMVASGPMGVGVSTIIGMGRPSIVYMITYKCKECGGEFMLQSSRR